MCSMVIIINSAHDIYWLWCDKNRIVLSNIDVHILLPRSCAFSKHFATTSAGRVWWVHACTHVVQSKSPLSDVNHYLLLQKIDIVIEITSTEIQWNWKISFLSNSAAFAHWLDVMISSSHYLSSWAVAMQCNHLPDPQQSTTACHMCEHHSINKGSPSLDAKWSILIPSNYQ